MPRTFVAGPHAGPIPVHCRDATVLPIADASGRIAELVNDAQVGKNGTVAPFLVKTSSGRIDVCASYKVRCMVDNILRHGVQRGSLPWSRIPGELIDVVSPSIVMTGLRRAVVPVVRRMGGLRRPTFVPQMPRVDTWGRSGHLAYACPARVWLFGILRCPGDLGRSSAPLFASVAPARAPRPPSASPWLWQPILW